LPFLACFLALLGLAPPPVVEGLYIVTCVMARVVLWGMSPYPRVWGVKNWPRRGALLFRHPYVAQRHPYTLSWHVVQLSFDGVRHNMVCEKPAGFLWAAFQPGSVGLRWQDISSSPRDLPLNMDPPCLGTPAHIYALV
jgi:hypothetical protein